MKRRSKKLLLSFAIVTTTLVGCSSTPEKYADQPVEVLYNDAMDHLERHVYSKASDLFDEVERQHPYSQWATKAQIMSAYASYKGQKYEKSIAALESFLQLHPAHEDVPYALYLQGLCYYEQLSPSMRDQKDTETALQSFRELSMRFPMSDYSKDARAKIKLLEDTLAGKEMDIARFYMDKKAYTAAINRFQQVVKTYQTTKYIEEALHRMVECYLALGLKEEATATAAVLGHNYPGSSWYGESYYLLKGTRPPAGKGTQPLEESWIDRLKNWNKGRPQEPTP